MPDPVVTSDVPPPGLAPTLPEKPTANGPIISDTPPKHQRDGWRSVISTVAILVAAPLIALALTAFVFQSYEVDGPSMETTLQNHDRLIVLKVPRTWAKITGHPYIPRRGDIVIFSKSDLFAFDQGTTKQLIKRVIGLPGDRVVVKDGQITIYNDQNPKGFQPDKSLSYSSVIHTTNGSVDIVVPPGQIFVCGDNRGNSLDSRSFGTVSANDLVGKLLIRIFPIGKAKTF